MALFQSLGMVAFFNDIASSLARYGVMATAPIFRISPGIPSGRTDLFLPIFANLFLITLVLINFHLGWLILFPGCYGRSKRRMYNRNLRCKLFE